MTSSQRLSIVRQLVETWCIGREPQSRLEEMSESILIRGGYYCGRRFQIGGFSAVWFAEEDEIKLFDPEGELIERLTIDQFHATVQRRAA